MVIELLSDFDLSVQRHRSLETKALELPDLGEKNNELVVEVCLDTATAVGAIHF